MYFRLVNVVHNEILLKHLLKKSAKGIQSYLAYTLYKHSVQCTKRRGKGMYSVVQVLSDELKMKFVLEKFVEIQRGWLPTSTGRKCSMHAEHTRFISNSLVRIRRLESRLIFSFVATACTNRWQSWWFCYSPPCTWFSASYLVIWTLPTLCHPRIFYATF